METVSSSGLSPLYPGSVATGEPPAASLTAQSCPRNQEFLIFATSQLTPVADEQAGFGYHRQCVSTFLCHHLNQDERRNSRAKIHPLPLTRCTCVLLSGANDYSLCLCGFFANLENSSASSCLDLALSNHLKHNLPLKWSGSCSPWVC